MTDNNEQNSAEREAEEILKDAFNKAKAEDCPQGTDCPVHFRNDEEYVLEDEKYARHITYVGDYAVVTEDNHVFDNPAFILKMLLGGVKKSDIPPRFETTVFHVGSGVIGDLEAKDVEGRRAAIRYAGTHDVWERVKDEHDTVVLMLKSDLLDVSKPIQED